MDEWVVGAFFAFILATLAYFFYMAHVFRKKRRSMGKKISLVPYNTVIHDYMDSLPPYVRTLHGIVILLLTGAFLAYAFFHF